MVSRNMTLHDIQEYLREDTALASIADCAFAWGTDGNTLIDSVKLMGPVPAALTPYISTDAIGTLGKLAQKLAIFLDFEKQHAAGVAVRQRERGPTP